VADSNEHSGKGRRLCETVSAATSAGHSNESSQVWSFGFQMNERYLEWDASAQARLIKLHVAEKLGWTTEEVRMQTHIPRTPEIHCHSRLLRARLCFDLHTFLHKKNATLKCAQ
jgi:hypothetical protein